MIQMQATQAGLAAIAANRNINFTRFVAGSGADEGAAQIQEAKQEISIAHSVLYLAGQTYTINGQPTQMEYNSIKLVGVLDTSLASETYQWSELALMAQVGDAEITMAYGAIQGAAYTVSPATLNTYVINFELIFSDNPNLTVETTQTGVTWADFLQHENANINSGVHGLRYQNGTLYINEQPMPVAQASELLSITGIDSIVSAWPEPNAAWLDKIVLNRVSHDLKRLVKSENLHEGQFIYSDDTVWKMGNGTESGALLVVSDEVVPSSGEINLSEAQEHFLAWQEVESLDQRLRNLEDSTLDGALSFASSDNNIYNDEWIPRMTGSGTEISPYIIRTPYDFNQIRNDPSAVYVLANNLDMRSAIGLNFNTENGILVRGDIDDTAPLYNDGNGFAKIPVFSGTLDGNGKVIRGLTCCGSVSGFIGCLQGGTIQNLILKDGCLVCTDDQSDNLDIGGFVGYTSGGVYITNCVNYNTIISTCTNTTKRRSVAGIVGYADGRAWDNNVFLRFCANHGRLYNYSRHQFSSACGIAATSENQNEGNRVTIANCYNTSNLESVNVAGITCFWYSLDCHNFYITNCYNSGVLQGANSAWSITNNIIADGCEHITNCWAREDYGTHVSQVHTIDIDDMRQDNFLEAINTELVDTAYVADDVGANNGLPLFTFERNSAIGVPGDLPVALLDVGRGRVYSSQFSYNKFNDCASKMDLRRLKNSLASLASKNELSTLGDSVSVLASNLQSLASKQELNVVKSSVPVVMSVVLGVSDWTQDNGLYVQSVQRENIHSGSIIMIIPQSADCFTYGLAVGAVSDGNVRFTASSLPADSVPIGLLITG